MKSNFIKILIGIYILGIGYFYLVTDKFIISMFLSIIFLTRWKGIKRYLDSKNSKLIAFEFQNFLGLLKDELSIGKSMENSLERIGKKLQGLQLGKSLLAEELLKIMVKYKYGISIEEGFCALGDKYDDPSIGEFGILLTVLKEKGGDTIGMIRKISISMLERFEIEREIEIVLAKGKMELRILKALPFFLILGLKSIYPEGIEFLYKSPLGIACLLVVLIIIGVAFKIGDKVMEVKWV